MAVSEDAMRSEVSFHRILYSLSRGTTGPRLGRAIITKANGSQIRIDTPGMIISTSRGVVPHLTRDHIEKTDAVKWVHVPFETFLERSPPIPTLVGGKKPLQTLVGLRDDRHVLSMSLRDPHDAREMPPNGNKFINANCVRGVRKMSPEQYRTLVQTCNPDLVVALSDIPFTSPPFSQRRITKSLERSSAWLASLLHHSLGVASNRHHPSNILVQMVGDISISARRSFAESLTEKLSGKEAEQIKPSKCLDDAVLGYIFDLIPLRTSLLVSDEPIPNDEEIDVPNRRTIESKPLTQPRSDVVLPPIVNLLRSSLEPLSSEKLRLITGASSPHEVLRLVRDVGIDLFDVAWAQKAADWGIALDLVFPAPKDDEKANEDVRKDGKRDLGHNLYSPRYATDFMRLADCFIDGASAAEHDVRVCPCLACSPTSSSPTELTHASADLLLRDHAQDSIQNSSYDPPFTRAYLHHLLYTHEMSAHALLTAHNLAVAEAFFVSIHNVLARGAAHAHHPHRHPHGIYHPDVHPETETFVDADTEANFAVFDEEVERFCAAYDGTLRIFSEAKHDWISVDYARGKGRLAREKAKQGEEDLATKPETTAEVNEAAVN